MVYIPTITIDDETLTVSYLELDTAKRFNVKFTTPRLKLSYQPSEIRLDQTDALWIGKVPKGTTLKDIVIL